MENTRRTWRWIGVAVAVVAIFAAARLLPLDHWIERATGFIDGMGPWAPALFALMYIGAALALVPGSVLTLTAGALFGLGWGIALVSAAATAAAACAFLIARYLARDRVADMAARYRWLDAVDRAIQSRPGLIVLLLRLSPVVPFSASNYAFGLTAVRFPTYVAASWLGMLPGTALYVYLGYAGRAAAAGDGRTTAEWIMLGVGLAATAVVSVYVARRARTALARRTELDPEEIA